MAANENPTGREAKNAPRVGEVRHAAYAIARLLRRSGEPTTKSALGRRVHRMRDGYALFFGYPSWTSVPEPVKALIRLAYRGALQCERLFAPFFEGQEVPRAYFTASENHRRVLADMGVEPRAPSMDIAAALAAMQTSGAGAETSPARSHSERRPSR
jgi:hypothetical protein